MSQQPPAAVALVTGASRGLGAAIALELALAGHPVAVNFARSQDLAEAVVHRIERTGGQAVAVRGDVTDPHGVAEVTSRVVETLGPVGVLVLNATGPQPTVATAEIDWDRDVVPMLEFFVRSPILLTQAVLPGMIERGRGRIVHIGSDVVQRAPVGNTAYVAAKSAQLGLARTSSQELGPHGITVNTVSPGWIPVERHEGTSPDDLAGYAATVPLQRLGHPHEVASAVAWLASDGASYVNGANIVVNGGRTT